MQQPIPGVYITHLHPYHTALFFFLCLGISVLTLLCVIIITTTSSNTVTWRVGLLGGACLSFTLWLWYLYLFT